VRKEEGEKRKRRKKKRKKGFYDSREGRRRFLTNDLKAASEATDKMLSLADPTTQWHRIICNSMGNGKESFCKEFHSSRMFFFFLSCPFPSFLQLGFLIFCVLVNVRP